MRKAMIGSAVVLATLTLALATPASSQASDRYGFRFSYGPIHGHYHSGHRHHHGYTRYWRPHGHYHVPHYHYYPSPLIYSHWTPDIGYHGYYYQPVPRVRYYCGW
jgi:hypothetical protein